MMVRPAAGVVVGALRRYWLLRRFSKVRMSAHDDVGTLGFAVLHRLRSDSIDTAHEGLAASLGAVGQPAAPSLHAQIKPVRDIGDNGMIGQKAVPRIAVDA